MKMSTHRIRVVVAKGLETFDLEVTSSSIVDNPPRLWIEESDGSRTYFMLDKLLSYTVGG